MKNIIVILICFLAPFLTVTGQEQQAQKMLSDAIYQEEVNGDLDKALKAYHLVIEKYPGSRKVSAEALLHMGMCYEKLGSEKARQTYNDLISKYPEQVDKVALARERMIRLETYAAELSTKAGQHMKTGGELFKRWEYESAIKEFENAIKLVPHSLLALNARYCIGQSLFRAGKNDAALATFTRLIEENPKSNIAPVAELMVAQVRYAIEHENAVNLVNNSTDGNTITDPVTGITFTKIKSLTGASDIITYTTDLNLSPNGKFLLFGNMVVPTDGAAPFELIDYKSTGVQATRGTWSPDVTKAAFYSGDALCVVPVSPETGHTTGSVVKIKTDKLRYGFNPGWSPDGKMLTYTDSKGKIGIIGADGNDFKQITENDTLEFSPAWSPDGKTIAYNLTDRYIGLFDTEKEKLSKLVETRTRRFPVWSPDGKWILDRYRREVYFVNLENRNELRFTPPKEVGSFFSWSPDKKKMYYFRTSYNFSSRLKIASPNGGPSYEPVPLLTDYWHIWRNDSKSLAVWGEDEGGNIVIRITPVSGGRSDIIHLDEIPGGKLQTRSLSIDKEFTRIVFSVKAENGEEDLYVVPVSADAAKTTGTPVKFLDNYQGDLMSTLSPDGEKMAFTRDRDIWIAFTNGDGPIQVTDLHEVRRCAGWTNHGTSLLFSTPVGWRLLHNPGPQSRIIKLLDGDKEIECGRSNIAVSPGNSRIAVLTNQRIRIIPVDDTKSGKVLDISQLELNDCYELTWSPDGKDLAFIGKKDSDDKVFFPDGKYLIYKISTDGGLPVRLAQDDEGLKYFLSWSPDGKWLAFSPDHPVKVRPESTIWEADFEEVVGKLSK